MIRKTYITHQEFAWVTKWIDNWARFMRAEEYQLGLPNQSLVLSSGYGANRSILDDWQIEIERRAAGIVDATLADAPAIERSAIEHRHLGVRWRYTVPPDLPYARAVQRCGVRLAAESFE